MSELTERQEAIVETAAEHPDASSTTIVNIVDNDHGLDVSPSYVRKVRSDYEAEIEERRSQEPTAVYSEDIRTGEEDLEDVVTDLETSVEGGTTTGETLDTSHTAQNASLGASSSAATSHATELEDTEKFEESDDEETSLFDKLLSLIGL